MTRIHKLMTILTAVLAVAILFLIRKMGISDKEIITGMIIGLAGGLTTASVLLLIRHFINGGLNPWIENLLYRDAHVEGTWIGVLVPYYGVEELDKIVKNAAMNGMFTAMKKKNAPKTTSSEDICPIEASSVTNGTEERLDAQLILPDKTDGKKDKEKKTISFSIKISAEPIKVRLDLNRVGHRISGRITELGGASDVHTYNLEGEFRNLIAAGYYDNDNTSSLDRGSYSMMLIENGYKLEGYFSVYSDEIHRIRPMKCILVKKNAANCDYVTEE
ncbi:MAG: hypothetical protein WCZ86_10375 [Desulfurivibrionaceae bacterium]|jgi:hypothetical protein